MMKQFLLASLPLLSLTFPVLATETRMGKAIFDLPDGWERKENAEGLLITREFPETEDTSSAAAMIQILTVNGPPTSLEANVAEMVSWVDGMSDEDPIIDSAGTTMGNHVISVESRCCSYNQDIPMAQTIAGVASEDEQLLVGLVVVNTRSDHEDAIDETFEALVRSIRFEGDGDAGMAPQSGDGGLEGVFTHLSTGLTPNVFGGIDFTSESEVVVFDKAGLFSSVIPTGEIAEHCAATPTDCGTYKVSGGGWFGGARQIEMRTMINGYGVIETETLPLEMAGDDLKIDDGDYYRLPPFEGGTTLDGTWTYTWASSGMSATSSGSIAVERTLVLGADGRFSRTGWSGGSTSGDMGGVTVSTNRPASSGRYEISGYELILTGKDGTTETLSIFAPDRGSDELLVINGNNYLKAD